jgi:hypothetical protein
MAILSGWYRDPEQPDVLRWRFCFDPNSNAAG